MQDKTVKQSVLLVTYNHDFIIHKSIDGALNQNTNFSYEIIIGEDCSTDTTLSVCGSYRNKYPDKIKILPNTENLGLNLNFINTLNACAGKHMTYLEGDDY